MYRAMNRPLSESKFYNLFVDELPGDLSKEAHSRFTPNVCYSLIDPEQVPKPQLLIHSQELADELGVTLNTTEDLEILSGNQTPKGSKPFSLCYGGHQFGHWAGQLGDGRAITYGSLKSLNNDFKELQLKGSGKTPYSRTADGKAVLRSSIREFLASEAMHHLKVPTTRALSLVATGEPIIRDMFYDGHPKPEPGAIVSRVAPSFLRFGNFEIFAAQKDQETLKKLIDWSVKHHFPHLSSLKEKDKIISWFKEICESTAFLMTEWLRVGFVHGVMNTDNMSVLGLTIDYGPFGWLEEYDPSWTPNTTDLPGRRYCFGRQAPIAFWNLQCLASALSVIEGIGKDLEEALSAYHHKFEECFLKMMGNKLGLENLSSQNDLSFLKEIDKYLQVLKADMTLFYRNLSAWHPSQSDEERKRSLMSLFQCCYSVPTEENKKRFENWLHEYSLRISQSNLSPLKRAKIMNQTNPKYILRNYMAFEITREIEENNNLSLLNEVFEVLKKPYDEQPENSKWASLMPNWAQNQPGSSTLSCSS